MNKKTLGYLILALGLVWAIAPHLLAYGEDIQQAGERVNTWLYSIGGIVFIGGLSWTALQAVVFHKERPFEGVWKVIAAGAILLLAPSIYNLLKGFAGRN